VLNHNILQKKKNIRSVTQNVIQSEELTSHEKINNSPHKMTQYYAVSIFFLPPLVETHLKILGTVSVTVSLWEKKVKILFICICDS